MLHIHNIFCVGRNYALHAKELNNEVPTLPLLFSKSTHALVEADGGTVTLPKDSGAIHYETELVILISRPYEKDLNVDDLVNKMALGIDFTLRDVQSELKKKGHPWLLAKGFKNSAVLTEPIDFPGVEALKQKDFTLEINNEEVQRGNIQDMIFDLQHLIDYTAEHFGLGKGDLIFTGTPAGVGPTKSGDHFVLKWGKQILGEFTAEIK